MMTDRITLRDRIERWRQRGRALRAWVSFWRSLSWRERNGLWVCWVGLEDDKQRAIFKARWLALTFVA